MSDRRPGPRGRPRRGARIARAGFTLIEVLLASTLSAVIGLAVAQLLQVTHRASQRARAHAEARALRGAIERRLRDDLLALVPPGGLYASGLIGEDVDDATAGEPLLPPELSGATPVVGPAATDGAAAVDARDRLTLAVIPPATAWNDAAPAAHGAFWSVVWEVDDDPETVERGLVRRVVRLRDPLPGSDPEPAEVMAAEGVGFDVRYWDGAAWALVWDSGASDTLPLAIEARATLVIQGELHVVQVLVAPVAARIGAGATASSRGQ